MRLRLLGIGVIVVAVVAGCGGGSRSVLDQGVRFGEFGKVHRIGPAEAVRDVGKAREQWLAMLASAARRDPARRFPSPAKQVLVARLGRAASHLHFTIESVEVHRLDQLAPEIVIESNDYLRIAHAIPTVLDRIDPPPRSNNRAYEGIFLEAVDSHGVPFVEVSDSLRGQVAGQQWARSEPLFPYAHG